MPTLRATHKTAGTEPKLKKPKKKKFDPEGEDYDYETAKKHGIKPDKTGHWPSRVPQTGILLKGKTHPTWKLTVRGEDDAGYTIIKKGKRYYSVPKPEK